MQNLSAGQLLCGGLFSSDCLSHWLSAVALSHALVANVNNKELLLRVHLAVSKDTRPVSLLQQTFNILQLVYKQLFRNVLYFTIKLDLGGQNSNSAWNFDAFVHLVGGLPGCCDPIFEAI